ncbi:MAG: GDSL-type esterase/lipase family protein [Elusimicrobiota bacterium]
MNIFIVVIILLCIPVTGYTATSIDADNTNIQYIGRIDFSNPKKPAFDWSGAYIYARFTGTSCKIRVQEPMADCWYNVFVDNAAQPLVIGSTVAAAVVYPVASGLADTTHSILITRRNEASLGKTQFLGFILDTGEALQACPARPTRRIEAIGDSITCGYGNMGAATDTFKKSTENNYLTYEAIAARALNADFTVVAWSGKGVIRNYDDSVTASATPLPMYYYRTLGNSVNSSTWTFIPQPQVITIHLGTNDFSTSPNPSQTQFENAYLAFVQQIRLRNPDAHIVCIYSTLIKSAVKPYIQDVVTQSGDSKVHFADLGVTLNYPADWGASGHPNVSGHQKMANALVPLIQNFFVADSTPVNTAPETPYTLTGSSYTLTNTTCTFNTAATDPDGDNVKYRYDWGDGTTTETTLQTSGVTVSVQHSWPAIGQYSVKTKAVDEHNEESAWSAVLTVRVSSVTYYCTLSTSINQVEWGYITKTPEKSVYIKGEQLQLTAVPSEGYRFTSWSGGVTSETNPLTLALATNTAVTANFEIIIQSTFSLTINISPTGAGAVTKQPNMIHYSSGTTVTLTAKAAEGYAFKEWAGDVMSTSNPVTFKMSSPKTLTAVFDVRAVEQEDTVKPAEVHIGSSGGIRKKIGELKQKMSSTGQ